MNSYKDTTDNIIQDFLSRLKTEDSSLEQALAYSLESPGKRLRPLIVVGISDILGASVSSSRGYAAAVEAIHCGSLVHDDLPALDNDDFRRGRPSCHKQFSEATALLTGDAFIPLAFKEIISNSSSLSANQKTYLVDALATATYQICKGQVLDIEASIAKKVTALEIRHIHKLKTAALFSAVFSGSGIIAEMDALSIKGLARIGELFGLLFQMADDLSDAGRSGDSSLNILKILTISQAKGVLGSILKEYDQVAEKELNSLELKQFLFTLRDEFILRRV